MKLLHITTVPLSLSILTGQISYMKAQGFDIHVISSPGDLLDDFAKQEQISAYPITMHRSITPIRDLVALWRLWRRMRKVAFDIVHAHTPKGGLLGMIAAWLAGVPIRIYNIHGLLYMTATGWKRRILMLTERISCTLSHQILCVSNSIREVAINDGICPAGKIKVLHRGSCNGVDATHRFNPSSWPASRREERITYGIPGGALVIGFVGRIVRDKGIVELAEAWKSIAADYPHAYLMLVGPFEPHDPVPSGTIDAIENDDRIVLTGMCKDTAPLYMGMDIFVLPTYREGFGTAAIEAAAMMIPVVASRIPGCLDSVQDGVTGTLVPPRDGFVLAGAIKVYLDDPELRRRHGEAGRERVLRDFRPEDIWDSLHREYVRLIEAKGLNVKHRPV